MDITLPWKTANGPLVTKRLLFTAPLGNHVWRNMFNTDQWKPALVVAGVIPEREAGAKSHVAAREHGMHAL